MKGSLAVQVRRADGAVSRDTPSQHPAPFQWVLIPLRPQPQVVGWTDGNEPGVEFVSLHTSRPRILTRMNQSYA